VPKAFGNNRDRRSDQYRILSRVSAGEPGRWRTLRTPVLREIMDCLSPSSPSSCVVFMKPAQIGGSEVLLNMLGYIIHYAPGPTMLVEPTVELAKRFSRQRIASLIENTPVLAQRVSDPRERDSGRPEPVLETAHQASLLLDERFPHLRNAWDRTARRA